MTVKITGKPQSKIKRKICMKCGDSKASRYFYRSYIPIHNDEMLPICKDCLREAGDRDLRDTRELQGLLRNVDRPFIKDVWEVSIKEAENRKKIQSTTGVYFKNINLSHSRSLTWEDSVFDSSEVKVRSGTGKEKLTRKEIETLEVRWGIGYNPEELTVFDKKYENLVSNYPVNTSLHEEALKTYVRYQVRAESATARGDARDAKTWGDLAQKQGEIAKINLNKLTKSDLSQGLDSFSELARMVEQEVDIIPILPQFIERPKDKIDLAIFSFINYERRLHGRSDCEYSEIYDFYQENLEEYMLDDTKSEDVKKHIKKISVDTVKGKKEILFYDVYEVIEQKKRDNPDNSFIQNLDKWVDLISYFRFFPDLWYDIITPESGSIKLDVDQRMVLRSLARFKSVYCVFPRGN